MTGRIKHVFFDLDHTLWDFDKNSGLTFQRIFNIHGIEIELLEFLRHYEPINLKYWKLYREEKVTKPALRYGRLKEAFEALQVSIADDTIHSLSEDYINHLTTFNHVFHGTEGVLNYLQQKYHLHIITNGFEEAQERKMVSANLKRYFKTVTNSEMVGVKKPNPKIFHFALQQAKADPAESVMIGDSLEADIEGAINVGMEAIWFDYKNNQITDKVNRITELEDLKYYL
ncbi:MAG: YjjG family noncanonical pyrimidine nucleotidase [Bacteroidia bacterium]|nr:YjjG family noncanonical pyrimidine nucleotidase [Bacteroidia bacterium]